MRKSIQSILPACIMATMGLSIQAELATFQQGDANSYSGTKDTYVRRGSGVTDLNYGSSDVIYILSSGNENPGGQGIVQFNDIFGPNPGQVPVSGQQIDSATLTFNIEGNTIPTGNNRTLKLHPMLQPIPEFGNNDGTAADLNVTPPGSYEVSYVARGWTSATSWLFWGGGTSNQGNGPVEDYDYDGTRQSVLNFPLTSLPTSVSIDVTDIVNTWYTGTLPNHGFFVKPDNDGFTGILLTSSEGGIQSLRPQLSISYVAADPNTGTWKIDGAGDWNLASNWFGSTPNAIGLTAKFGSAITAPHTVYSDSAVSVSGLVFDNTNQYVLAGAGSLTLEVASGSGSIEVVQGNHKINLPFFIASDTNVNVAGGATLTIGNPMTVRMNQTVTSSGSVVIQAPLTLEDGASVVAAAGTLGVFGAPSLGTGAKIDVMNNTMVVDYTGQSTPAAAIEAQLTTGSANGAWNGDGIMTSSADGETALGWVDDSVNQQIIIDFTYRGDANLDGVVDSMDFDAFVAAYGSAAGAIWAGGDFNYDDKVNTLDFNDLAGNFGKAPIPSGALGAVVPEPSMISIAAVALAGLLTRRLRH